MRSLMAAAAERAMKRQEVILRALSGALTWVQAAEILGIDPRSLRRWRAWRSRSATPRARPRAGARSRGGGAADADRTCGPPRCAWRGRPTASRRADTFGPAQSGALPSRRRQRNLVRWRAD